MTVLGAFTDVVGHPAFVAFFVLLLLALLAAIAALIYAKHWKKRKQLELLGT